ncbi:MAG TPA: TIGR01458 family HAD-type hydrolase [Caldithrix sp.]|nr:TIGR01458 family HAD-type hydrolase [Caldithrix sp.]
MKDQLSGLIIDIDGVLITGNQRIPGAIETLTFLAKKNFTFVLVTNTTRKSLTTIWHQLKGLGFPVEKNQIMTAPVACANWLKEKKAKRIHLLVSGSAVNDFKNFTITSSAPEYIVVGDLGNDLTFDKLNTAFRLIMKGAKLIALQKNRFWQTARGLSMDAGAIVAALEYATRKRAILIGKPKKEFFLEAVKILRSLPDEVAMIGDDLEADIGGAHNAGLKAIAVRTGKFENFSLVKSKIQPDLILDSIADLPKFIKE